MSAEWAVVLFHTTSHALRAEKVLGRAGIACRLVPVPRHLSSDCGLCVRVELADARAAEETLRGARVDCSGVHPAAP